MRRWLWLVLPLAFLSITILARFLQPDPSGYGTHRALGLPPCFFFWGTGLPCPSCGLTTSFCHLMRLHWIQAFQTHPLGPLLFLLFMMISLFSLLEFFGKRTGLRKFLMGRGLVWVYGGLALYFLVWGGRLVWAHP